MSSPPSHRRRRVPVPALVDQLRPGKVSSVARFRAGQRIRVAIEALEPRKLLASIAGTVFNDIEADGLIDPGENGLGGWTVYHDANGNGVRDSNAPVTTFSSDVPKNIVDNTTVTSNRLVSGMTGVVADVNVTL